VQCQIHDLGHLLVTDRGLAAAPCGHLTKSDQPSSSNWPRQSSPLGRETSTISLISEFDTPSAANNKTWARCTTRYAALGDLVRVSRTSRCPSDIANGAAARLMPHSIRYCKLNCERPH
jgi:hypothetical protein